jgi:hypothetical protein
MGFASSPRNERSLQTTRRAEPEHFFSGSRAGSPARSSKDLCSTIERRILDMEMMRVRFVHTLLLIALLLPLILPVLIPVTYAQNYYLRVRLDSATLNGQSLSTSNPELRVNPGSRITGTVTITVENVQPGSWITPVIWVTSWERGTVSNGRVRVIADDIRSTRQFTVNIDVTAPSSPGTYYIGFFAGWAHDADDVASNHHPPNYGDGDDVWDMPAQGWEEVISNGQASTGPYRMPGRAIRIVVVQQQQGTLQHFDLDYHGTPPNSDGNDQTTVTVSPCSRLTLFFYYREGNAGNNYIIRVYAEWDKNIFIANSDNNEAGPESDGREIGGFRWDVEDYTVPCTPGTYKVRVVYRASTTPPTWDSYDRLLAEGTVIVVQQQEEYEIQFINDDGSADFGFVAAPGTIAAVKFVCITPSPCQILKMMFYVWGEMKPVNVLVLDSDFKPIFSRVVDPKEGWFTVDISDANVIVGGTQSFYIGFQWTSPPSRPWLGVDTTPPHHGQSYLGSVGNPGQPKSGEDYMIRVQVKVSGHLVYRTQIEELQKKVSDLTGRLQSTMVQLEEALRSLDLTKNALEEERRQRAAIQADLNKTRAELQRTREILDARNRMISELLYALEEADERASTYLWLLQLTMGVAAVTAVVASSILLLRRRRSSTITVPATQPLEQRPSSEELEIRRLTTEGEATGHMAEETVSREIVDERRKLMVSKYLDFLQKLELTYRDGRISKEVYERLRSEYLGRLKELGYDTAKLEQQG